jgi:hypothetical protein
MVTLGIFNTQASTLVPMLHHYVVKTLNTHGWLLVIVCFDYEVTKITPGLVYMAPNTIICLLFAFQIFQSFFWYNFTMLIKCIQ